MEKLRSVSVPKKNFFPHEYRPSQGYDNSDFAHRRGSSIKDDLRNNNITPLGSNINLELPINSNFHSLPTENIEESYYNSQKSLGPSIKPVGDWRELITKQGEAANIMEMNYKKEDKLRALKYNDREALDQMIQEEKRRKAEMKRDLLQPRPDQRQIEAFLIMEKNKEQEDKKQYCADIQRLIKEKEDAKRKEQQQRFQENMELKKTVDQLQEYDNYANYQKKLYQKQAFVEYQSLIDQKQQLLEQKKREEKVGGNYYFYKQDEERKQLFEKIRNKANNNIEKQINHLLENQNEKKKLQMEEYLNRSVQEKAERDTIEMIKRQEAFKKLQMETHEKNRAIAYEKMMKVKKEKEQKYQDYGSTLEQKRAVDYVEELRKEQEMLQKKEYLESLKSQVQARQENKYRDSNMTTAEKIVNFRRTKSPEPFLEDNGTTSLPLNGRSYERNLQLRYIDSWLSNNPHYPQQK